MNNEKRNALFAWMVFGLIITGVIWTYILLFSETRFLQEGLKQLAADGGWGLVPILYAFVGVLIVSRQPRNVIGLLLMLPAFAFAIPTDAYLASFTKPPALSTFLFFVLWFNNWGWVLLIFPILFILVLFPTGEPPAPRWRSLIYIGVAMMFTMVFLTTFGETIGPIDESWAVPNPLGFIGFEWVETYLLPVWFILLPALTIACAIALFSRFRRSRGVEREQIKWLFFAASIFAVVYIPTFVGESYLEANPLWNLLFMFGILTIPSAIAIAILRYRLYDIDIIIRKTLQYALLTGLLALTYFGGIVVLQGVFGQLTGESESPFVIVLSTLAIAALFNPLRSRVQDFIDRRFYRKKYDAEQTLAKFAETARDEVDMEKLSAALLGVVEETMQPEKTSLWLKK